MRVTTSLLCAFILLVISGLSGCSIVKSWRYVDAPSSPDITIYVVSHGWHTGIVLPAEALGPELGFLETDLGDRPFYEIGWGDKGFYEAHDITTGLAIRAIFWPTESVVHAVALSSAPQTYFTQSKTIPLRVGEQGLNELRTQIAQSFNTQDGHAHATRKGLYGRSLFYPGTGDYHMTNTCNTWTARMLESAGVPVSPFLTLTASSVMRQAKNATQKHPASREP